MSTYAPLLAVLVGLLAGLAIGKAWERYKLRDGKWLDRRRARESPHYILGLNFLVANQIDLAIEELSRAASVDPDALEVHMILGNLYREKGQVGKAITVHQSLLQRPRLTKLEHAYVLLCLGLDYKRGGFVDRALEAFNEVLRLDSKNEYALVNLQKLHEEQHQWTEAYDTRERLSQLAATDSRPQSQAILAFLENEIGLEALRRKDHVEAVRRFDAAIDLDARAVPAYLNLGDVRVAEGDERGAAEVWEKLVDVAPDRAYLAFERLEALARRTSHPERFTRLCRRIIDENPQDWRARLALSRHLAAGDQPHEALDLLFSALVQNPHALSIHQAIWRALGQLHHPSALVDRYRELTRHAVFYLDPHVCMRCRYRSTELLWQCPHCHDWNTFVEERIAPAQDASEVEV
ncbi:MAG TPA: tetratricopeptide repeat protein [Vicinamibacterales bacterium]|jgi:lipopolysaccharide biosynthesis regulator YciM|nr:tetratricopeptide repeat protein [Vicinamibacterales bacterium]